MRRYVFGYWPQGTGRRGEEREGIVDGGNGKDIGERWYRWMVLITIGLKEEALPVC
jgi:hypothetical protein